MSELIADPEPGKGRLDEYAYGKALSELEKTVFYYQQRDIAVRGEPKIHPRVTRLGLSASPKTAAIRDCYDSHDLRLRYVDSGKKVRTPRQNLRYVVTARAEKIKGRWYIVDATSHRDRAC